MRYAGLRALAMIAAGIALQYVAGLPVWFWVVWAGAAIAAVKLTKGFSLLLVLLATAALYLQSARADSEDSQIESPVFLNAVFDGTVVNEPIPHRGGRTYAVALQRVQAGDQSWPIELNARVGTGRYLHYGDHVRFSGSLLPFSYPRNPGLVDLNGYFRRQGLSGRIRANSVVVTGHHRGNPVLQYVVMPLRRYVIDVIGHHFAGKNRALLAGLLLGETGDLPEETMRAFSIAGVTHILAVSGLNVAILVGVCTLLLAICGIRGWPGLVVTIGVAALYVGITGLTASAFRAGLMAIALVVGNYIERRYDPLNGLFIAGIIILITGPLALFDVGFQLSFAATAAILLFSARIARVFGRLNKIRRVRDWLTSPFSLTAAGTIGTAPLIMYYFSRVSLLSFLANLVVVPLAGIAMPLGMLVVAVHGILHALAGIMVSTLDLNLSAILLFTEKLGSIPWAGLTISRPNVLVIIWLYALILLLALITLDAERKERRARAGPATIFFTPAIDESVEPSNQTPHWAWKALIPTALVGLAVLIWVNAIRPSQLRVTFLDVPQSEATYVEFPNGRNLLVDAGNAQYDLVTTFLESRGVSQLDLLAITHPHPHVCTGVEKLLGKIRIARALVPIDATDDSAYSTLLRKLKQTGTEIVVAERGDEVRGLDASLRVLSPTPLLRQASRDHQLSANDLSLVLRLDYRGNSLLLPGDLDNAALLEPLAVRSTILKAPHQGSVRANSDCLLDMVRPGYLVVGGRWRISPKLEARLAQRGVRALNTRRDGAVVMAIGGKHGDAGTVPMFLSQPALRAGF